MPGTKAGGLRAAATNKEKYGEDYYAGIGRMGGQISSGGGFAQGEAGRLRAVEAGRLGGRNSRRSGESPVSKVWKRSAS